jgi:hypothetical protein
MKKDYFKDTVRAQFQAEGNNMYLTNSEFITDSINSQSKDVLPITAGDLEKGKFYFIFYDLKGKSSKMEKFNPLFLIDWNDQDNTRYLYAVSINFIPVGIRTVFFNNLYNFNLGTLEDNNKKDIDKQYALENTNFANIYKLLYSIGFEWSIRKFDVRLINKIYTISTSILPKFITMSTARLTGVDDLKLIEIWNKKITEQEARQKKLIKEILGDYKKMSDELNNTFNSLQSQNDNLDQSLQLIQKLF